MNFYRIDLQYIGTQYSGWQSQTNALSIQDVVEKGLRQILNEKCRLTASSRTDSGVHAYHQVARLRTERQVDPEKLHLSLQALIPKDIGILSVTKVDENFHPGLSSKAKLYRYSIWLSSFRSPFWDPFSWQVWAKLDLDKMRREAKHFLGTHDYSSFCASDSSAKTKVRTVLDIQMRLREDEPLSQIYFLGKGFLKQMVRNMVGTLVEVGMGRMQEGSVPTILAAKDRTLAARTAPAQGLALMKIYYESEPELSHLMF